MREVIREWLISKYIYAPLLDGGCGARVKTKDKIYQVILDKSVIIERRHSVWDTVWVQEHEFSFSDPKLFDKMRKILRYHADVRLEVVCTKRR